MRILFWLPLLFFVLELYLLVSIGSQIGALAVVLWVILAAALGVFCIRYAGVATVWAVRERMARGEQPDSEMLTGMFWFVAGVLLIIPGFFTDFVALILLLPFTRNWLGRRMKVRTAHHAGAYRQQEPGQRTEYSRHTTTIIEGEYQRHDDKDEK